MARYINDQNKVVLIHESGTYSSVSGVGIWPGQVTDISISDNENKLVNRYLGTSSRDYGVIVPGPRDVTGTLTLHAQDMRLAFWAIGSNVDTADGAIQSHTVTEVGTDKWLNPFTSGTGNQRAPMSFTLEDSKQAPGTGRNFIRTVNGCTSNTVTVTASQGEKVTVETDFIGQTLTPSSGTTTSITEQTNRPYLWSDCTLTVAGSVLSTPKEVSLEINNNMEAPHYLNGSRDIAAPFVQNKDYILSVTADFEADLADMLYNTIYKSNASVNVAFDLDADTSTGSQHTAFALSGCKITSMEVPSPSDGVNETTIEFRPKSVTAYAWDSVKYNPW